MHLRGAFLRRGLRFALMSTVSTEEHSALLVGKV
jgi:hypothetical protein